MTEPLLLYTVVRAAELLSVSQRAVERLVASGELKSVRVGRLRRIAASDLHAFVEDKRQELVGLPAPTWPINAKAVATAPSRTAKEEVRAACKRRTSAG